MRPSFYFSPRVMLVYVDKRLNYLLVYLTHARNSLNFCNVYFSLFFPPFFLSLSLTLLSLSTSHTPHPHPSVLLFFFYFISYCLDVFFSSLVRSLPIHGVTSIFQSYSVRPGFPLSLFLFLSIYFFFCPSHQGSAFH